MVLMTVCSFLFSLGICPLIIKLCKKFDIYDEVDPRKIHTGQIPRLGGIAVFSSFIVFTIIHILFVSRQIYSGFLPIFIGFLIILITGISDDFLNIRARVKFVFQIVAALCVAFSPLYLKSVFGFQLYPIVGRFMTFFWILLLVNAYNMIDGLDWLCGGLSFITLVSYGVIAYLNNWESSAIIFILCGALLGFLFWNKPNAKIFLGDGGSLSLGFVVAVVPLLVDDKELNISFEYNKVLISLLMASVPSVDVLAAVIRRAREHRSFFSPDRRHLHHKLLNIGFSKITILMFVLSLQLLICGTVVVSTFIGPRTGMFALLTAYMFVLLLFVVIHYINISVTNKMQGHLEDHPQEEH